MDLTGVLASLLLFYYLYYSSTIFTTLLVPDAKVTGCLDLTVVLVMPAALLPIPNGFHHAAAASFGCCSFW